MTRRPGWRLWGTALILAVVWAASGYWLSSDGNAEMWIYRIGLTAATIAPLLFVGVYTWLGLSKRVPAAWWRDEIGTSLVIAAASLIPIAAPLAYVFWFENGMLTSSWLAWLEVSGPCVSAIAWIRLCEIWVRMARARRRQ